MGFASNALVTKIRSMHGLALKVPDYELLLKKRSVFEITVFLKNHPSYKVMLEGISESSVNRSRLEGLIRKRQFELMMKLIKFSVSKNIGFYNIHIVAKEHQVILQMIKSFISDETYDVIKDLPVYFNQYSKLDLEHISRSKDLKELVDSLKNTKYYDLLKNYQKMTNDEIKYYVFEALFESEYYRYIFAQIDKYYFGKTKKEIQDVFKARIEVANMIKIYRLKKYYQVSDNEIKDMLIASYNRFTARKIDALIKIKDPDDILKMIAGSEYQKFKSSNEQVYLEYFTDHLKYRIANKLLYYSSHPAKVYLAYMILSELEVDNLTHLIEGTRYLVNENQIRKLLVY